jgi:EmrB/QacA subfamily drug resistance transporter
MVMLDATIVNVALPSIRSDLGFSDTSLVWVINAYLVPYGGFLILCGRLADYYGHRRTFLLGIALFTLASAACAMAPTPALLVCARGIQGIGGAAVLAVSVSAIAQQFDPGPARARALSIYSCMSASGGSAGVLLGGVLTSTLGWRWIFLANVPVGAAAYALCYTFPFRDSVPQKHNSLDVGGAVLVTVSMTLAIATVLSAAKYGWWTSYTTLPLCATLATLTLFIAVESHAKAPIIPVAFFRHRNVFVSVIVGALWAGAHATWCFVGALDLQQVWRFDALRIGLAFLPATLLMAVLSLALSGRIATRFGARSPFTVGLLLVAAGLALLAAPSAGRSFAANMLPGMVLVGLGWGVAYNSFLLIALSDVSPDNNGVASGVLNSSTVMGGAVAVAGVASLVSAHSSHLVASGTSTIAALSDSYRLGFRMAALFAGVSALLGLFFHSPNQFRDAALRPRSGRRFPSHPVI